MNEHRPAPYTAFEAELHEVERMLVTTADELGGPLGELVRGQVFGARPSVRAALVLTVAMIEQSPTGSTATGSTTPTLTTLRQARMNLAAALEMLYIALNIHRLLVDAVADNRHANDEADAIEEEGDQLNRAFVGSTILAGDYCFSRAAQLAAHTDHPTVVALFAQALQTISESRLRHQFGIEQPTSAPGPTPQATTPDDTVELLESGAHAAAVLVAMDAAQRAQAIQIAHDLASQLVPGAIPPARPAATQLLDVGLQTRRQILLRWLSSQPPNGRRVATTSADK